MSPEVRDVEAASVSSEAEVVPKVAMRRGEERAWRRRAPNLVVAPQGVTRRREKPQQWWRARR